MTGIGQARTTSAICLGVPGVVGLDDVRAEVGGQCRGVRDERPAPASR